MRKTIKLRFACSLFAAIEQAESHLPRRGLPATPPRSMWTSINQTTQFPKTFYGLMTEEINHAYDGGTLLAELIQNRTFQDPEPRRGRGCSRRRPPRALPVLLVGHR